MYVCFVFFFCFFLFIFSFTRLFHTLDNNNCCDEICFLFYFSFLFVSHFTFRPYFVLIFWIDSFIIYFDLLLKNFLRVFFSCVCVFFFSFTAKLKMILYKKIIFLSFLPVRSFHFIPCVGGSVVRSVYLSLLWPLL